MTSVSQKDTNTYASSEGINKIPRSWQDLYFKGCTSTLWSGVRFYRMMSLNYLEKMQSAFKGTHLAWCGPLFNKLF